MRHDLLYQLSKDSEKHEDGEHLIREFLLRRAGMVEGETDEETGEETERKFGVDIGGCSPILSEYSFSDLP